MADLSAIKLPNGTTYNIKDATARSQSGVTGVKGNSESTYRTGQVNLTPANLGAVALSGNETVAGNKTFSGTTTLSIASTYPTQSGTIIPANATAIIQSPIPKYLWHDIWAFCRAAIPKYYTSTNGSSWTEATLEKNLFAHKEAWGTSNVLSSSIKGSRWTWLNGGFYASTASWLVLGVTYKNPSAHFDLLLETSSDSGSTWTTLVNITDLYYSQTPIWIRNTATCQDSLRLTITWNSNSASNAVLGLCSIRFLTSRWGDQGKGSEFEHPYTWDANYNISPLSGAKFIGDLTGNVTGNVSGSAGSVAWANVSSKPTATGSKTTGITASTTATKTTLGTAFSIPNVTSAGSASTWTFEEKTIPNVTSVGSASTWSFTDVTVPIRADSDTTVPTAASSATACDDITAWSAGSGSYTQGSFSGGSGSFSATVTNHVLSFSHTHTAATHGNDSHTHTAPSLSYTARSITGVSGSTTVRGVKTGTSSTTTASKASGANGTAPTLGTAIKVQSKSGGANGSAPTLGTAFSVPNVTGNTSATVSITDNGHTHSI